MDCYSSSLFLFFDPILVYTKLVIGVLKTVDLTGVGVLVPELFLS